MRFLKSLFHQHYNAQCISYEIGGPNQHSKENSEHLEPEMAKGNQVRNSTGMKMAAVM